MLLLEGLSVPGQDTEPQTAPEGPDKCPKCYLSLAWTGFILE